jgi:hypothetical protein
MIDYRHDYGVPLCVSPERRPDSASSRIMLSRKKAISGLKPEV